MTKATIAETCSGRSNKRIKKEIGAVTITKEANNA